MLLAFAMLFAGMVAPSAFAGGDSDKGDGDGTGLDAGFFWKYKDDASGSWGAASDFESVEAAFRDAGVTMVNNGGDYNGMDKARDVLASANELCINGFKARHPNEGDGDCRVVAVGAVYTSASSKFDGSGHMTAQTWIDDWNKNIAPNDYNYAGNRPYKTSTPFDDDPDTSVDALMKKVATDTTSIAIIVLDKYQPAPANYNLTGSTQAASGITTAGQVGSVRDRLTLSRNGSSITENVNGKVTMYWRGVDGTFLHVAKDFTAANDGTTDLPEFWACDLKADWTVWPGGKYWFDISIPQTGKMSGNLDLFGENEASESWSVTTPDPTKDLTAADGSAVTDTNRQLASGSLYTAHIRAQSNAAQHLWLYDIIDTKDVVIGATDKDDLSKVTVSDPSGKTVAATVSVDDSESGKRIVKARVDNTTAGEYVLNVPQAAKPTGNDYTIKDDSKVCYGGDNNTCQTGNSREVAKVTPNPNKVWVLDEKGALTASDPNKTNDKGVDTKTFVTGDTIGAVVNGKIPGHLLNPFTSYSITDDWSDSANWIDWNHKDQVKVYVDGTDETSNFTITIDTAKHTTTATAKASFLAKTALGTKDRAVKLYIGGIINKAPSADYAVTEKKLTNSASETWNNETTPTNDPPVYVRNPKPDKIWSASETQAATASDSAWTNKVNADTLTFVPQDDVSITLNGTLPKNLAANMTAYELGDDFTNNSKYVNLDSATVRVTIDGKESTSSFDVHKEGTKLWVTAKQSLLNTSANQKSDRKVRVTIKGAFKKDVLTAGQEASMTNGCWEKWNNQTITGNDPPVKVRMPKPDKVWSADQTQASGASDSSWTNKVNADDHTFVQQDDVSLTLNGTLPKNLAANMTKYELGDDFTACSKYVDLDAATVVVTIDGKDSTSSFDVHKEGTKLWVSAKQSLLNTTYNQANDRKVRVTIKGAFKAGVLSAGQEASMTNGVWETWNRQTVTGNTPPVKERVPKPDKTWSADQTQAASASDSDWKNNVNADTHTFVQQDDFGVTVNGILPKNLAANMTKYELGDDFTACAKYIDLDAATVVVTIDGKEATSSFDVHKENNKVWVSAKQSLLNTTYDQANDRKVRVTIKGLFTKGVLSAGQKVSMTNTCFETWNRQTITGNTPPVKEWSPNPDKSWIKLGDDGKWQAVIDPDETNKTGADTLTFLDGDEVASVVNGTIANDLVKVTDITLTDDYANADYIWDLTSDTSKIRVYEADATTDAKSSITDIVNKGKDVTSSFDIKVSGTKVTATAKAEYRAKQVGLKNPKQITLLLPGVTNFANGKGAAQVRKDFGKAANAEVTFCSTADGTKLTNKASEKVNNETQNTNEPYICGYIPPTPKYVEAEASQGGGHEDIDTKVVFPGQKVEYALVTQPTLPNNLAYRIKTVGFVDYYDQYLTPDKQTLEIIDLSTGRPISKKKYTTTWDDANHKFTAMFTDTELIDQWKNGGTPKLQVRFEGTVNDDAPAEKIDNHYELILNNSITPSNEVENGPPELTPEKADVSSKDPTISIDGKTLLLGETGNYVVTLDAKNITEDNTAYKVQRLGIVDDFDDEYLSIDQTKIEVLGADGKDVTSKFNVQLKDGIVYVFAKTVDTEIPATGETVKGDPQPTDLKAYSEKTLDPLNDPSPDQSLLGQQYQIVLPYTVVKVTDGYVVENTATQITNDRKDVTNTVSNPLKPINPSKDVTIKVGGDSMDGKSIYKDHMFLYQLDSSTLPSNRAYSDVEKWSITDQLDPEYDQYTGQWAVYAASDLYKDGKVLAKKGDRIAGSDFDSTELGGDLFTLTSDDSGLVTITATDLYLKLVSADSEHELGWTAYIQCKRIQYTERHENQFTEHYNDQTYESNVVWTKTPDMTPSLKVEKWDTKSGFPDGDRDNADEALTVDGDTDITFTITNTSKTDENGDGAVFQAKDLTLADITIAGDGEVTDLKYPDNWDTLVLKPGESVDIHGTLKGVTETHTDSAKVTGTPLVSCPVEESDPFGSKSDKTDDKSDSKTDDKTDGKTDDKSDKTDEDDKTDGKTDDKTDDKTDETTDSQTNTVTINGQTYCTQPTVESNTDEWHGKPQPPLAQTGAIAGAALAAACSLAGIGLVLNRVGHKNNRKRHAA